MGTELDRLHNFPLVFNCDFKSSNRLLLKKLFDSALFTMGIDLDPLDDIFAAGAIKNARTAGKFQPKSKFRPPRNDSATTSCSSSRAVQVNGTVELESREPVRTAKSSEHDEQWNSGSLSFLYEKVGTDGIAKATVCLHSGVFLPSDNGEDNGGWHLEKSVGENADIFVGLESLGDFLPPTSTIMDGTIPPESIAITAPNSDNAEGGFAIPVLASVGSHQTSAEVYTPSCSLASEEPIVSGSSGVCRVDNRELETAELDVTDPRNVSELITGSEKRSGKFHPKPKMQVQNEMCEASIKTVSSLICSQQVLPEISYTYKDSIPAFEQEDVLDLSSIELAHAIPSEATSELPVHDDPVNLMETNELGINLEGVPEMPAKLASRRAKTRIKKAPTASDPTQPPERGFTFLRENEAARCLRSRTKKRNLCELVDESEDEEVLASREFPDECAGSSAVEEDNINYEEYQVESESQMRSKRKAKIPVGNKEKTARKRKESPVRDTEAKPKRFSHSTWRKKVDKVLLETPEDEIDYQKVPLRDLILLAEHKERQTKKEAAAAGTPLTKQSYEDSSECCNEYESFTSKQGIEHNDGQEIPRVEEGTIYFNYQTYMDRTPSTRWSKQDTELFYEAVRQFGTDLSLIKQLFRGRTRRQVKLKYKKEERQHPLRLREALTNRAKDHSYFETVIGRLQKIAAEENENAVGDGSTELRGNDVAEDEAAKNEQQIEEQENEEDAGLESAEVGNSFKSYDSEDDMLKWSQYRSDL